MVESAPCDAAVRASSSAGPYTPTLPGYLVMLGLVFMDFGVVVGVIVSLASLTEEPTGGVLDVVVVGLVTTVMATAYGAFFGLLPALLGLVIVHLLVRRVRAQWVHVLAFGVAGAVLSGPPLIWLTDPDLVFHPLQPFAGACAALVRLVVLPWVPSVKARREEGVDVVR